MLKTNVNEIDLLETQTADVHLPDSNKSYDLPRATRAIKELLDAFQIDLSEEGLAETPHRAALAYAELFTPKAFKASTFPNIHHYDELVIARSIPFHSVCEHHLLPFFGVAHVGYLPAGRIVGLSKLARLVEYFSRRPQVQENLTSQIANWLQENVKPLGVGVILEAEHLCMSLRGVRAPGVKTVTSCLKGQIRENPQTRQEFLSLANIVR